MRKLLFLGIIVLAVFLRFWRLGEVPVSPDWDEAALGYNAYSILKTGRDEYGTFLPRSLRSFDDYKPPLYMYLAVPSVAAFGLNTWSVRLPSAVMGVLAVIGTYYLVLELFKKNTKYALMSSFLLAISPWHLQFSRIAFEANTGVTLNTWGLVALLKGLTSFPWMAASAFLFGLSLYAYHSERIFVPLMLLTALVIWHKELFRDWRKLVVAAVIGVITVAPLIPVIFDKTSITRLRGTSTLSDQTGLLMRSVLKLEDDRLSGREIGALFDNRRIVYARTLLDGYISHFSLRWLFFTGDNDRHHAPDMGLMYLWELPLLLVGIYSVWRVGGKGAMLLISWILLAPVAASPTSETPHAIRTLVFLPALQILTAVGMVTVLTHFKPRKHIARVATILYGVFIIINTVYYFHMYYAHLNHEYSRFWQYGYEEAVRYAEAHKTKYDKIVVSTTLEQPHMFFLFYTKYDPVKYLAAGGTASGGFEEIKNKFDVYEFRSIPHWHLENHDGKTLYIGSPREMPNAYTIKYLNGEDAMQISE